MACLRLPFISEPQQDRPKMSLNEEFVSHKMSLKGRGVGMLGMPLQNASKLNLQQIQQFLHSSEEIRFKGRAQEYLFGQKTGSTCGLGAPRSPGE